MLMNSNLLINCVKIFKYKYIYFLNIIKRREDVGIYYVILFVFLFVFFFFEE